MAKQRSFTRSQLYRSIRDYAGRPCTGNQLLVNLQTAFRECEIDMPCAALSWGTPPFGLLFKTAQTPTYGILTLLNISPEQLDTYTDALLKVNGLQSTLSDLFKDDPDTLPQWLNHPNKADVEDLNESLVKSFSEIAKKQERKLDNAKCADNTITEIRRLYLEPVGCSDNGSLLYIPVYDSSNNFLFQGAFAFRNLHEVEVEPSDPALQERGNVTQVVTHAVRIFMAQAQALAAEVTTDLSNYNFHSSLSLANQASHNLGHTVKRAISSMQPEHLKTTLQAMQQRMTLLAAQTSHHMLPASATIFTNPDDLLPDNIKKTLWGSDIEAAGLNERGTYLLTAFAKNESALKSGFLILPYGVTGGLVYVRSILENLTRNAFRHAKTEQLQRFATRRLHLVVSLENKDHNGKETTFLTLSLRGYKEEEARGAVEKITKLFNVRHLFVVRKGAAIQERSRGLADIKQSCCLLAGVTAESALEELATMNLTSDEVATLNSLGLEGYTDKTQLRLPWGPDFLHLTRTQQDLYEKRGIPYPGKLFDFSVEVNPSKVHQLTKEVHYHCGYVLSIPVNTAGAAVFTNHSDTKPTASVTYLSPSEVHLDNYSPLLAFAIQVDDPASAAAEDLEKEGRTNLTLPLLYALCTELPDLASGVLHLAYAFQLRKRLSKQRMQILFQNCNLKDNALKQLTEELGKYGYPISFGTVSGVDEVSRKDGVQTIIVAHDDWMIKECCVKLKDEKHREWLQLTPWASNTFLRDSFDLMSDPEIVAPVLAEFAVATAGSYLIYHETLHKTISTLSAQVKWVKEIDNEDLVAIDWLKMNRINVAAPRERRSIENYEEMFDPSYDFLLIHASFLDKGLDDNETCSKVAELVMDNRDRLILLSTSGRRTLDLRDQGQPLDLRFIQFDAIERALTRISTENASKADLYRLCSSATSLT